MNKKVNFRYFKIISMQIMGYLRWTSATDIYGKYTDDNRLIFGGSNSGQILKLFAADSATYLSAFGGDKKLKNLKYLRYFVWSGRGEKSTQNETYTSAEKSLVFGGLSPKWKMTAPHILRLFVEMKNEKKSGIHMMDIATYFASFCGDKKEKNSREVFYGPILIVEGTRAERQR